MDGMSVKLPATLRNKLAAEARRRNVAQSTIVRESLERFLGTDRRGAGVTCADLVADLVGSVRSGRKDLASNKALLSEAVTTSFKRESKRRR